MALLDRRTLACAGGVLLGVAVLSPSVRAQAPLPDPAVVLLALQAQDRRVESVGHRLATRNVALCRDRVFRIGITPHHLSQYGAAYRPSARKVFTLDTLPSILAVADGSPAGSALAANDRLVAIDDIAFQSVPVAREAPSFGAAERAHDAIDRALADGVAVVRVERAGRAIEARLTAVPGCRSRFQVVPASQPSASADGTYVQLSPQLAAFAKGDGELAAMLAHELAHNLLAHRLRLERQGVVQGRGHIDRRGARLIRATEIEADRLSPYLIANAGYDPRDAVRYWRRHGARRGDGWFGSGTHPRWRERVSALEREIERIDLARARGQAVTLTGNLQAALQGGPL